MAISLGIYPIFRHTHMVLAGWHFRTIGAGVSAHGRNLHQNCRGTAVRDRRMRRMRSDGPRGSEDHFAMHFLMPIWTGKRLNHIESMHLMHQHHQEVSANQWFLWSCAQCPLVSCARNMFPARFVEQRFKWSAVDWIWSSHNSYSVYDACYCQSYPSQIFANNIVVHDVTSMDEAGNNIFVGIDILILYLQLVRQLGDSGVILMIQAFRTWSTPLYWCAELSAKTLRRNLVGQEKYIIPLHWRLASFSNCRSKALAMVTISALAVPVVAPCDFEKGSPSEVTSTMVSWVTCSLQMETIWTLWIWRCLGEVGVKSNWTVHSRWYIFSIWHYDTCV